MPLTTYNITIDQGATYTLPVQVFAVPGTPYDLTNFSVSSMIRTATTGSLVTSFTGSVTDTVNGWFQLTLPADQTSLLSGSATYVYDTKLTSGSFVLRSLQGNVYINPSVTH